MERLVAENLTFSYDGRRDIFSGLHLSIDSGQIRCLIGPNGCGKTTLIDCLLGLNKPSTGRILVRSGSRLRDIRTMRAAELAEHIAYVPQGHKTTFGFTVLDVVTMGRTYAAKMFSPPGEAEREIARDALAQVGLDGFEDRDYTRLSGGELQLVILARAIAQRARVLIMDEPTAHLDFRHEMRVMEIVARLVKENNLSIIMATHFLNQAYYLENAGCDTRVSLMNNGRIVREGTPGEVLTEDTLEETFNIITEIVSSRERRYILPIATGKKQEPGTDRGD
ncbi:MAG: ABC transporter ATP-binding protein [Anaerovoracaceae bacterium]|jgi:iron complex transport system ATP-binding protein